MRMDTLLRDLGTAEADADRNAGFIAGSTWAIRAGRFSVWVWGRADIWRARTLHGVCTATLRLGMRGHRSVKDTEILGIWLLLACAGHYNMPGSMRLAVR